MKIFWMSQLLFFVMLLSACTIPNESYQIPLDDFKTEMFDEIVVPNTHGYLSVFLDEGFIDILRINNMNIMIPEEYEILDDTIVYINFEINEFEICNNNIELHYFDEEVTISEVFSCSISLLEEQILKDQFFAESVDIYIKISYTNTQDNLIIGRHLFTQIDGNLIQYMN